MPLLVALSIFEANMNRVLGVNQMALEGWNMDYDGDSANCLKIDSEEALKNDVDKISLMSNYKFEHTGKYMISFKHECVFAAYRMSKTPINDNVKHIDSLDEISITHSKLNDINTPSYEFENKVYSYVTLCINKVLGFNKPLYDGFELGKKGLNKLFKIVEDNSTDAKNFLDKLYYLQLFFLECSTTVERAVLSFDMSHFLKSINDDKKYIIEEPVIAFHQIENMYHKLLESFTDDDNNSIKDMFLSGSRLNDVQFKRAFIAIGNPTNEKNNVNNVTVSNSLLDGLSPDQYFSASSGSRQAIALKESLTPKGGAFQRRMMLNYGMITIDQDTEDCHTNRLLKIKVEDEKFLQSLSGKYYLDQDSLIEIDGQKELIGREILIRTPILCECKDFKICKKCWGNKQLPSGKNVGISMSSYLAERFTQLSMRSHHTSGAADITFSKDLYDMISTGEIKTEKPRYIYTKNKDKLLNIMKQYYNDVEINHIDGDKYEIIINETLRNADVTAIMNRFLSKISRNTDDPEKIIDVHELFQYVMKEILSVDIIKSSYLELLISMLYLGDDMNIPRYSENIKIDQDNNITGIKKQISMDDILKNIDPRLVLFYDLNNDYINRIYRTDGTNKCKHALEYIFDITK